MHTHSCTQWMFDISYTFLIALLMQHMHIHTHYIKKCLKSQYIINKPLKWFLWQHTACAICCPNSIWKASMAWISFVTVVFSNAILGNVIYCGISDMNACNKCYYFDHSWLGNARLSNFSLKWTHGWKSSDYPVRVSNILVVYNFPPIHT